MKRKNRLADTHDTPHFTLCTLEDPCTININDLLIMNLIRTGSVPAIPDTDNTARKLNESLHHISSTKSDLWY